MSSEQVIIAKRTPSVCNNDLFIHVPQFSSLKQNKTCTRKKDKEMEGGEGNSSSARMKGETQRVFCCASVESASRTHAVINTWQTKHTQQSQRKRKNPPHQRMTDIYHIYFLGQLEVENMQPATSSSEKP